MTLGVIGVVEGDPSADLATYPFGRPSAHHPPKLFREPALVVQGATVCEVSFHLGTYGMGGPGFLGFLLNGPTPSDKRWMVITLWAAAGWATLDGALVAEEYRWPGDSVAAADAGLELRELTPVVVGATLVTATCTDDVLSFDFDLAGATHRLEIRSDGRDVLPWRGNGKRRSLEPGESLRDAVVISTTGDLWTDD